MKKENFTFDYIHVYDFVFVKLVEKSRQVLQNFCRKWKLPITSEANFFLFTVRYDWTLLLFALLSKFTN